MEKDYSLLRPFDLEAAKAGELLIDSDYDAVRFVGSATKSDEVCVEINSIILLVGRPEDLFMAPLAWVEGRPVYRGDVLYKKAETWGKFVKVTGAKPDGEFLILECDEPRYSGTEYADNRRGWLSWQKPKTKREGWVNIYSNRHGLMPCVQLDNGKPFKSYDNAMQNGIHDDYIGAIKIEWEE